MSLIKLNDGETFDQFVQRILAKRRAVRTGMALTNFRKGLDAGFDLATLGGFKPYPIHGILNDLLIDGRITREEYRQIMIAWRDVIPELPTSSPEHVAAYEFAKHMHAGQHIPGSEKPYHLHVLSVAIALANGVRDETSLFTTQDVNRGITAAILHDTIEDTKATREVLACLFNEDTADDVLALSKRHDLHGDEAMIDSIQRILMRPPIIAAVKLADRYINMSKPPKFWSRKKKISYMNQAQTIHDRLGSASPNLSAMLQERINAYPQWIDA